jgi:hypothetical protein
VTRGKRTSIASHRLGLTLLAWLLVACGSTPPVKPVSKPRPDLKVLGGALEPARWLGEAAAKARKAGAGPLEPVAAAVLSEGDQIGSFVELPKGQCAVAIARGGRSVRDIDLFVYSDAGERLGADEAPDPTAAVMLCPPQPRRVYVAARIVTGAGMVALGMQSLPSARAKAVAAAVRARGMPDQDTGQLSAWPGLETKIREHRRSVGSRWDDVRRTVLPLDPRSATALSVPLPARRCIDVLVVPNDEVHGVHLTALDAAGRVIARAAAAGRDRSLVLCGDVEQVVNLQVRPRGSSGVAAVIIGRSPEAAVQEVSRHTAVARLTPLSPLDGATARNAERLSNAGYAKAKTIAAPTLATGRATELALNLGQGCARVDVIGGQPLGPFRAELWSHGGRALARGRGGETAALIRCGPATKARLEIEPLERGGPTQVELRTEPTPPKVLLDHPVAAGRLLSWLESASGTAHPRQARSAEVLSLGRGRRETRGQSLQPQQCVEWIAVLGDQGEGLELRLLGPDGVLERASGERVASLRHCAGGEPESVRLQLSLRSGTAKGLILRR